MSELKFIEGPLSSEQLQSLIICAKLGHSTTPAVLVALLDQLDAQRLRADTAEAERDSLRMHLAEARLPLREIRQECNHSRLRDGQIDNFLHKSSSVTENPNAAEQRIAELIELLNRSKIDAELWFNEFGEPSSGNYSAAFTEIGAALNPNPEAESHE